MLLIEIREKISMILSPDIKDIKIVIHMFDRKIGAPATVTQSFSTSARNRLASVGPRELPMATPSSGL